jgi:hypothetical protein
MTYNIYSKKVDEEEEDALAARRELNMNERMIVDDG